MMTSFYEYLFWVISSVHLAFLLFDPLIGSYNLLVYIFHIMYMKKANQFFIIPFLILNQPHMCLHLV